MDDLESRLAEELDLDPDYLSEFQPDIRPHESDDGLLYGYNVYFAGDVPPEIEDRLTGDHGARWLRVGLL